MSTGIVNPDPLLRSSEPEITQEDIDYWCDACRFNYRGIKCESRADIQRCWNESFAVANTLSDGKQAHIWHLLHECPFVHKGLVCRCNDYKTIKDAFRAAR